jgi:hypothetical protein
MDPEHFVKVMKAEGDQPLEFHVEDLKNYLHSLISLLDHLKESKYKFPAWVSYSEILIGKFIFNAFSLKSLCKGIEIKINSNSQTLNCIDLPSIHVLGRSLIENYLTYNYLYAQEIQEEEKFFRFKLYEHAGLKNRSFFYEILNYSETEKQEADQFLNEIKDEVENDEYYITHIKGNSRREHAFNNYGLPIIKNSWMDLIKKAKLKQNIFGVSYKLQCQFAHSEFLSLVTLKKPSMFSKANPDLQHDAIECLEIVKILISFLINDLAKQFPPCKEKVKTFPESMSARIAYWTFIGKEE